VKRGRRFHRKERGELKSAKEKTKKEEEGGDLREET